MFEKEAIYKFYGQGTSAVSSKDQIIIDGEYYDMGTTVLIDVGNCQGINMFDHHNTHGNHSAASLIYESEDKIKINKGNHPLTIITHSKPDLDAIIGTYMILYHSKYSCFPKYANELINFARSNDEGKLIVDNQHNISPLLIPRTFAKSYFHDNSNYEALKNHILERSLSFLEELVSNELEKKPGLYKDALFKDNQEEIRALFHDGHPFEKLLIHYVALTNEKAYGFKEKIQREEDMKIGNPSSNQIETIEKKMKDHLMCVFYDDIHEGSQDVFLINELKLHSKRSIEIFLNKVNNLFEYNIEEQIDNYILKEGLKYVQAIFDYLDDQDKPEFNYKSPCEELEQKLRCSLPLAFELFDYDRQRFDKFMLENEAQIESFRIRLFHKDGSGKTSLVKGIYLPKEPNCIYTKEYLRSKGYVLTIIPTPISYMSPRYYLHKGKKQFSNMIISVTEDHCVHLKGLARRLELAERQKEIQCKDELSIAESQTRIKGTRNGYENKQWSETTDPWFDGESFDYTIIATPKRGSLLTYEEIWGIFCDSFTVVVDQASLNVIVPFSFEASNIKRNIRREFKSLCHDMLHIGHEPDIAHGHFKEIDFGQVREKFYPYMQDFYFSYVNSKKKTINHEIDQHRFNERALHYRYVNEETLKPEVFSIYIYNNGVEGDIIFEDNDYEKTNQSEYKFSINHHNTKADYRYVIKLDIAVDLVIFRYGVGFIQLKITDYDYINYSGSTHTLPHIMMCNHIIKKELRTIMEYIEVNIVSTKSIQLALENPIFYSMIQVNQLDHDLFSLNEIIYKLANGLKWSDYFDHNGYVDQLLDQRLDMNEIVYFDNLKNGCATVINKPMLLASGNKMEDHICEMKETFSQEIYHICLLSMQQRYSLMFFSKHMARYSNKKSFMGRLLMRKRIKALRRMFIDFTTQGYFSQITPDDLLGEVYRKMNETNEIDRLYEEVENQLSTIDEYNSAQFNDYIQMLSYIGIPLVILGSLAGTNVFEFYDLLNISAPWFIAWCIVVGIIIWTIAAIKQIMNR